MVLASKLNGTISQGAKEMDSDSYAPDGGRHLRHSESVEAGDQHKVRKLTVRATSTSLFLFGFGW
jgi:hypothetical protein